MLVYLFISCRCYGARTSRRSGNRCSQRRHRYYSGGLPSGAVVAQLQRRRGRLLCVFLRDGDCVRDGVVVLQLPRNARVRVVGVFLLHLSEVVGRALPPRGSRWQCRFSLVISTQALHHARSRRDRDLRRRRAPALFRSAGPAVEARNCTVRERRVGLPRAAQVGHERHGELRPRPLLVPTRKELTVAAMACW